MANKFNWQSFSGVFLAMFFLFGAVNPEAGARVPLPGTEVPVSLDWVQTLEINLSYSGPISVTPDGQGNVYVLGTSEKSVIRAKYDSLGHLIWSKLLDGPKEARAVAVDSFGNFYITEKYGAKIYKFAPDGLLLWQREYLEGPEYFTAMSLDGYGNVYVSGNKSWGILTIKYNSDGREVWAKRYVREELSPEVYACVADSHGNLYLNGSTYKPGDFGQITIKYDFAGNLLWTRIYGANMLFTHFNRTISLDSQGNVVTLGFAEDNIGHYVALKYSPDGQLIWDKKLTECHMLAGMWGEKPSIIIDSHGDVFFAVLERKPATVGNMAILKYSADGERLWVRRYFSAPEVYVPSVPFAMAADNQENVYITGMSGDGKCITLKYSPDGARLWKQDYSRQGDILSGKTIVLDGQQNVYVGGTGNSNLLTLKYSQTE